MNILFLDIDGVLNSRASFIAIGHSDYLASNWNPVSIKLLAHLCKKCNLDIYVHSTWTMSREASWFKEEFAKYEITGIGFLEQVHSFKLSGDNRTLRVKSALEHYKPDKYIIIDDDPVFELEIIGLHKNFVLCDFDDGFGWKQYEKAMDILGNKDVEIILG